MHRAYHHLISLGLNCEPSFVLEDMYGRLDSYPLSWTLVPDAPSLARALREPDLLFAAGYEIAQGSFDMFRCPRTGIRFHGKIDLRARGYAHEAAEEGFAELVSRLTHLRKKFRRVLDSGRDILCIVKNHHRGGDRAGFSPQDAHELRKAIGKSAGRLDLLCVDRAGCEPSAFGPEEESVGIYKRLLEGFAPGERAYLYDIPGWARIFAEFGSVHSSPGDGDFQERTRAVEQRLAMRREERLRDMREKMPPDLREAFSAACACSPLNRCRSGEEKS
jgi:hypothetical protein